MIGYLIYFDGFKSDDFINSPYNTRQDSFSDRVVRGKILSSDGQILAQTNVSEDGTETRNYPYSNMFSHVVGYDTNGKSGLESEANFTLLTSHSFFLTQMKNQFLNEKNTGDTVVSTLNANLQSIAYNALGDRRGAVVVMEPSTGKRLVEVSKPDFDPNTIGDNWDYLVNDENDSSLLNRATNGAYPPGSTFKVVTALDYFRKKGTFEGYNYLCEGSITLRDHRRLQQRQRPPESEETPHHQPRRLSRGRLYLRHGLPRTQLALHDFRRSRGTHANHQLHAPPRA